MELIEDEESKKIGIDGALTISMQSIRIFSLSRRLCSHNTVSYEINDWTSLITIKNELPHHSIIIRISAT